VWNNRGSYEEHFERTNYRPHREWSPPAPEPRLRLVRRGAHQRVRNHRRKTRLHHHLQLLIAPLRRATRPHRTVVDLNLGHRTQSLGDARRQDERERPPAPLLRPSLYDRPQWHHRELRGAESEAPASHLLVRDRHRGHRPPAVPPLRRSKGHAGEHPPNHRRAPRHLRTRHCQHRGPRPPLLRAKRLAPPSRHDRRLRHRDLRAERLRRQREHVYNARNRRHLYAL